MGIRDWCIIHVLYIQLVQSGTSHNTGLHVKQDTFQVPLDYTYYQMHHYFYGTITTLVLILAESHMALSSYPNDYVFGLDAKKCENIHKYYF